MTSYYTFARMDTGSPAHKRIRMAVYLLMTLFVTYCGLLLKDTFYGDPSIYFVFAKNLAAGLGLSYNPGEFSSGATSPLWVCLLSIPFHFEDSVFFAKTIGLGLTILAALFLLNTLERAMPVLIAAAATLGFLQFLLLPGLLLYESPLAVLAVCGMLRLQNNLERTDHRGQDGMLRILAVVWGLLPLIRPDAVILSGVQALLLYLQTPAYRKRITLLLPLSLLPFAIYCALSFIKTGQWSAAGVCRAFALQESAKTIFGFHYTLQPLRFLFTGPMAIWSLLALWGFVTGPSSGSVFQRFVWLPPALYLLMMMFLSPVTKSIGRYLLPALPFLFIGSGIGLYSLVQGVEGKKRLLFGMGVMAFLLFQIEALYDDSIRYEQKRGLHFDIIMEKEVIARVNRMAAAGQTVLAYEVQDRFFLREDLNILSLDGIVDGKVAPYLAASDLSGFLKAYRPDYWLANEAVRYRPYLSKSLLRAVLDTVSAVQGASATVDGITFTLVEKIETPPLPGFAGCKGIYRLSYHTPVTPVHP
ncbi:MAG: hypothetical protein V1913_12760, partial [Fibrobacterota bacterium]